MAFRRLAFRMKIKNKKVLGGCCPHAQHPLLEIIQRRFRGNCPMSAVSSYAVVEPFKGDPQYSDTLDVGLVVWKRPEVDVLRKRLHFVPPAPSG